MTDETKPDGSGGDFWVNGIVAVRNGQPYVQLSNEKGMIAQLTMRQTQQIAMDMLVMASRTEADAMIFAFFSKLDLPPEAAGALMAQFREFRAELDSEKLERPSDQEGGLPPRSQGE
jgi:hypothetical protein